MVSKASLLLFYFQTIGSEYFTPNPISHMMMNSLSRWDTIVLIEGDRILNYVNRRVLQLIGFKGSILLFSSGNEALDFLKVHFRKLGNSPNKLARTMVFVDDDLPDMDAADFLEELEKMTAEPRGRVLAVLMVAGNPSDQRSVCNHLDLSVEVVSKPLTKSVMTSLVAKMPQGSNVLGGIE